MVLNWGEYSLEQGKVGTNPSPFLPPDSDHGQRRLHPHLREGDIDAVPSSSARHMVPHSPPASPLSSPRARHGSPWPRSLRPHRLVGLLGAWVGVLWLFFCFCFVFLINNGKTHKEK